MILDGRISRVQFETLAFPLQVFPVVMWFKRWFAYAPPSLVCSPPRSSPFVGSPRLCVRTPRRC